MPTYRKRAARHQNQGSLALIHQGSFELVVREAIVFLWYQLGFLWGRLLTKRPGPGAIRCLPLRTHDCEMEGREGCRAPSAIANAAWTTAAAARFDDGGLPILSCDRRQTGESE